MPEWLDGITDKLGNVLRKKIPVEKLLPKMLDPGDPRVAIRPLGDDWLCPYTGRRIDVPGWDGSSLTLLHNPEVVEHLVNLPLLQKKGQRAQMMEWDKLVQLTVLTRIKEAANYKVSSEKGEWVCPHCLTNTGVLLHQWDGTEAPMQLYLPQVLDHLRGCHAYQRDPLGARPLEDVNDSHGERAVRIELLKRVAVDPVFHVCDDTGTWICPFTERPIESINLMLTPWGNVTQNAIVEYLLSPGCPARYSQWQTERTVSDLQRVAGKLSMMKAEAGTKKAAAQEMKMLKQRVDNLAHTAAAVTEITKELEAARKAQLKMLPEAPPKIDGYEVASYYAPSVELGGDLYHFMDAGEGHTGFLIGDVSGHGVEAAVIMSMTLKSFSVRSKGVKSPADVMCAVNEDLVKDIHRGKFVTSFYAVLEHDSGTMKCVRAGHNPALLLHPDGSLTPLEGAGLALGLGRGDGFRAKLDEYEANIPPGGIAVFYTDGIPEAMNMRKEEFGEARLQQVLVASAQLPPDRIIHNIVQAVNDFAGSQPMHDDLTLVVVKRLSLSW
jgi:serine phosphatase RsbU (regulator of sigma subunit)